MSKLNKRLSIIESKVGVHTQKQKKDRVQKFITVTELEALTSHELASDLFSSNPLGILEMKDPVCAKKLLYEIGSGYIFDLTTDENEKPEYPESRFVQIQNPSSKEWCLIDREIAQITEKNDHPYKDIPIITVNLK